MKLTTLRDRQLKTWGLGGDWGSNLLVGKRVQIRN